ncbi:fluoride efflux transporter CrcB [Halocola ammonii]
MNLILAVFIGGGLGSVCRYALSLWTRTWGFQLPMGTLLSNILACVVLGLAVGALQDKLYSQNFIGTLVIVGFCGAFSTFSTFSFETLQLIKTGHFWVAAANVIISLFTCLIILWWLMKKS